MLGGHACTDVPVLTALSGKRRNRWFESLVPFSGRAIHKFIYYELQFESRQFQSRQALFGPALDWPHQERQYATKFASLGSLCFKAARSGGYGAKAPSG